MHLGSGHLDVIDRHKMATANRDYLRGFYSIIKDNARDVRFVFVTGVSMFFRVSQFSGLKTWTISLDPVFATISVFPTLIWIRNSRRNFQDWTGTISGNWTTATTDSVTRISTTPSTCCFCSGNAGSNPSGSRTALPLPVPKMAERKVGLLN